MPGKYYTNFIDENGYDLGSQEVGFIEKEYLIENYPQLVDWRMTPSLWLWGRNDDGGLGDNSRTDRSSPVQTIAYGTNWKKISAGRRHSMGVKSDGTLWAWGANGNGQLGDNSITNKSSPVQTVSAGTTWKLVSSGYNHSAAIKTDNSLWLWGEATLGKLGNNSTTNRSSPVQTISTGTNWRSVSCGFGDHTGAIKTDNTLWLWGRNTNGQLGDNSITHRSSPVQTVSAGTNWKMIALGRQYSAAIKTDGTLWTWGENSYGQLGDNSTTNRSSPVQTVAGGTWIDVNCGRGHTIAIKTDGTLWAWGLNTNGQLGDNSITHRSSPVQIISSGNNLEIS